MTMRNTRVSLVRKGDRPDLPLGRFHFNLSLHADGDPIPERPPALIENTIPQGQICLLYGDMQTYKSFAALDFALHIAEGKPWHGREVTQTPVVFVSTDGTDRIKQRAVAWDRHHGFPDNDLFIFGDEMPPGTADGLQLWANDVEHALGRPPGFVVLDDLFALMGRGELSLNDNRDIPRLHRALETVIHRWGASILLLQHLDGDGNLDGPTTVSNLSGAVYEIEDMPQSRACLSQKRMRNLPDWNIASRGGGFRKTFRMLESHPGLVMKAENNV